MHVARIEAKLAGWEHVRVTRHARIMTVLGIGQKDTWLRGMLIVQTATPPGISQRYIVRDSSGHMRAVVNIWQVGGDSGGEQWISPGWSRAAPTTPAAR